MAPRFAAAYFGLLVGAVALSIAAADAGPLPGDLATARRVQDLPGWFGPVAEAVRLVTGTQVVLVIGAVLAITLFAVGERVRALALGAALAALPLLQAGMKDVVDRPRPDAGLLERRVGFSSESFPSGHVMSGTLLFGFALYLTIVLPLPPLVRWVVATLCVAVLALNAVANVYEGVHWPTDVVGGLLGAAVLLMPTTAFAEWARRRGA